ncbi:uncharacterized protein SPAPADRAFT_52572 [Spathaspora passalidarum NRRL Y-27907]|uniref:RRM domain-containing protein n=1 Tax=Spathaspora passalidarum (strain NRRL Y-27907 / 11-Y1) TaxID=619300 RepID=G3AUB6_SPAPN|nr:uncharacterized protein SPAPADRAFT_52572 [Spathaspora passalidarum NRRL Y-27907]EGW30492.1 hypothetical protein SPAPADRAFT_52572 [Spathaspora passalidarum NRRL Y-27907]
MTTRIHIGSISPNLQSNPDSLTTRLEKFGKVVTPLSFHTKPTADHYFAYVTLDITSANFDKLKGQLNGVTFMGRKLSVSIAKPSYLDQVSKPDHTKQERITRDKISQIRQARITDGHTQYKQTTSGEICTAPLVTGSWSVSPHTFENKSANTKNKPPSHNLVGSKSYGAWTNARSSFDKAYSNISGRGEVIKARHRTTPRKDIRHQTLRLLINDELKLIKCYKTKLWGFDKKPLKELSFRYESGQWINGDGELIERVDKFSEEAPVDDVEEHDRNKSLLASIDFSKPAEIEGEDGVSEEEEEEEIYVNRQVMDGPVEGELAAPVEEVYYDEDDEGNDVDFDAINQVSVPRGETEEKYEPVAEEEAEAEAEEDRPQEPAVAETPDTNNLDTLRSLFNAPSQSTFKLELSDDDIEETTALPNETTQQQILEQIQAKQETYAVKATKFGLFWPHLDSPFLSTQSQLNKIGSVHDKIVLPGEDEDMSEGEETKYEKWFWNNRGEISRMCKRRRRDVLRIMSKRKK